MFVRILEYLRDCVKLCQRFEVVYDYDPFELPRRFYSFRVFDNFKASLLLEKIYELVNLMTFDVWYARA